MAQPAQTIKIALLQLMKVVDKQQNIKYAAEKIREAVKKYHPKLVVLPECFQAPYETRLFAEYSEPIPNGPTSQEMSKLAKELNIYIVATFMEKDGNKTYNTATVWGPQGNLLGKHRKVHLFDVDMDGAVYHESEALTPGNDVTIVNIEGRKVGILICNDMRFAEFARIYRSEGCEVLIWPAAFNVYMGDLHWDLILRARANDNQVYVAAVSNARGSAGSPDFDLYGHSFVINPFGVVMARASEKEEFVIADLDFNKLQKLRQQVPIEKQRRTDIYDTIRKK